MSHSVPRLQPATRNGRTVLITPTGVEIGLRAAPGTNGPVPLAGAPVGTVLREHARHAEQQWHEAEAARRFTLAHLRRLQADAAAQREPEPEDLRRGAVLVYIVAVLAVVMAVLVCVLNVVPAGNLP